MSTSSQRPGASTANSLSTANYQYPDTLGQKVGAGQHYMLLESFVSVNSLNKAPNPKSSIALYIPAGGLSTTTAQSYEEIDGGALFAQTGAQTIEDFETMKKKGAMTGEAVRGAVMTAAGIFGAGGIAKLKRNFLQRVGGGFIQAGLGLAVNNHLSVGYKGPSGFRDHTFAFKFFPKNKPESDTVKDILEDFHNGSTPRKTGTFKAAGLNASAFFQSPRHWTIKFLTNGRPNEYLHEIKTSVITQMQTNYDPISMVSFHQDGSPVQIDLNLTFKEIELVTSADEPGGIAGEAMNVSEETFNEQINTPSGGKAGMDTKLNF